MRLAWLSLLAALAAYAQMCPPGRILPTGSISATLDNSSCFLSDSTAYAAYRLDLPVRGAVAIDLTTTQDFILLLRDATGARIDAGASIRRPLDAGAYTVVIDARIPGQAGAFTVRTSFTPEPGIRCRNFPSLGLSQKIDSALGASGCALPDGSLYEAYRVKTFGGGTLTVNVAADWTPAVFIRTPDGAPIATGDTTTTATLDPDAEYLVVVSTADAAGAFTLSTSFTPADGETCVPAATFLGPDSHSSVIGPESCVTTLAGSDPRYYRYYPITVDAAGLADFTVATTDFGPTLEFLDQSGALLATDSGGPGLRLQLRPGNYIARVLSWIPSGAYTLTYNLTPGDPRPCPTVALDLANPATGTLAAASCRTEIGLADLYTITLPSAGTLDLMATPVSALSAAIALRDTKDNLLLLGADAHVSADLPAGTYTVAAGASAGAGVYQLAPTFTAHELAACPAPQTIDTNGGYVQRLNPASCRAANGAPVDYYQFTLPEDAVVATILTSSEIDGYLTLADATGVVLRRDDNSYGYNDPLIIQHLPAGTYRLAATAAAGPATGLYQVDVRTIPGPRPPFCAPKSTLAIGASVTGTINFAACQYPDDTFADIYKLELPDTASLTITLASAAFSPDLLLLDAKGNLLNRSNAALQPTLPAGTYYLVAKPATDYTAGGQYTLSLQ